MKRTMPAVVLLACLASLSFASHAEVLVLEAHVELTNTSGGAIKGAVLSLKLAEEIAGVQKRTSLDISGATVVSNGGQKEMDYASVDVGDFLLGERKTVVIQQALSVNQAVQLGSRLVDTQDVGYEGYRSRVNLLGERDNGDCTERALAAKNDFFQRGVESTLVGGMVKSVGDGGLRFVTPHDWLLIGEASEPFDPSVELLPGSNHQYIVLGVIEDAARRFPLYRINREGIEVSLKFR